MPDPDNTDPAEDLDAIAERLYSVRPDEFVPERDDAVTRAREAGDRELARAIGRLRRPTKAAWLANLLARNSPEKLEGLLGIAAGLADAQRTLDGAALRTLSSQRHRLVKAVANEAGRLAGAQHEPVTESQLRDLQGILEAALADPVIADEVRSARLTRTVSYSGFGPASDPDAVATPAPRRPAGGGADKDGADENGDDEDGDQERDRDREEREREKLAAALATARAEQEAAEEKQQADDAARDDAVAARESAKNRITELTVELENARRDEREATTAAREAENTAKASARAAGLAASATARAQALLEDA